MEIIKKDVLDSLFVDSDLMGLTKKDFKTLVMVLKQYKDYIESHEERLTDIEKKVS